MTDYIHKNIESISLTSKNYYPISTNRSVKTFKNEKNNNVYSELKISNIQTVFYNTILEIKFDYEIFREAYINQRKQYKLLQGYLALINEQINEDEYDLIEDDNIIEINDYDQDLSQKAIYRFLKNHQDFVQDYEANELSEILGLPYSYVNKIIKNTK